ncbi:MAG: phenylalanine--tRNA ligase subunit beta [Gammaproteobacteria bacterium]
MRVPLRWMSDYVDLPDDVDDLAQRLTIAGAEVGQIIRSGRDWDGIVVAQVTQIDRHPNADRLVLATVDRGNGHKATVVCGAPNVAVGQKVAFAPPGTTLIDGHSGKPTVLKPAVIRGVESAGMICSEKELGISDSHEGILVLAEGASVGRPLASVLGDTVFDMDLTPNRADLLSILGVAREVAALTDARVRDPSIEYVEAGSEAKGRAKVEIADPDLCPRYVAALVEGITVDASPFWMQERLLAAGMRPINNIVDITNYVMLEMGQPLHAFDFKNLRGGSIIVRRAREAEVLTLIDGSETKLSPDMLVIAGAERAVAVAGVMGGRDSEITEKTTTILLESANFNGPSIRRTSQALKTRTDASVRFEKGLSQQLPPIAAQRAVKLMVELCGGRAAKGLIDVGKDKGKETRITLTQERLQRVLGVDLPPSQVRSVLSALGFGCRWVPPDRFVVRVPYWRTDVTIPDDVIEEVARIVGYDQLPTTLLAGQIPASYPQPEYELRERVRDGLAAAGFQEIITYSLTDLETLRRVLPPEELATTVPLKISNPMSREHEYARTTLRGSVLQTLAANLRLGQDLVQLFETGRVYIPRENDLPQEAETLCAAISGRKPDRWGQPSGDSAGFYDARSHLDNLLALLHVKAEYKDTTDFAFLPGRTAEITVQGEPIGLIGEVHPRVAESFDIESTVAIFEIELERLLPHIVGAVHYEPVSPYPAVVQDLAITVDKGVRAALALELIKGSKLVQSVSIFDIYEGPPVPKGRKSLAFSIRFQAPDRTLTEEDAARERSRIAERLKRELDAELRA